MAFLQSSHPLQCSPGLKHPLHHSVTPGSPIKKNNLNKVLSACSESLPARGWALEWHCPCGWQWGERTGRGEGLWAALCRVLAPAWSSSWGWNALEVPGQKGPEQLKLSHVTSTWDVYLGQYLGKFVLWNILQSSQSSIQLPADLENVHLLGAWFGEKLSWRWESGFEPAGNWGKCFCFCS